MTDGWENLSTLERQDAFLAKWVSGQEIEFKSEQCKKNYRERAGLIASAYQLRQDQKRVPNCPMTTFGPTNLAGLTGYQAMYEPELTGKAYLDFCTTYKPDAAGAATMLMYGPALESLQYKLYKWPGNGVAKELYYQFCEKEYMKADEYDWLIGDPTDFWLRSWMPKTHGALAPLANIPPIYGTMELPMSGPWLTQLGTPAMQKALKALMEAGKHAFDWINKLDPLMDEIMATGYPFGSGGVTKAPFDVLSDSLRGTTPTMLDLFRRPEKVLEACERLVQPMIDLGVSSAAANNNPTIFLPLHKGADNFMSDEQFMEFYWPTLKKVMYGLAEAGCVPACFVEGAYNQRLEHLRETSDIRCFYLFDRTDMALARKILGGRVCFGGGFPVSMILTASPAKVRDETRRLLDAAAGDKGYILSVGCALDEAKAETMQAYMEAGREFGIY